MSNKGNFREDMEDERITTEDSLSEQLDKVEKSLAAENRADATVFTEFIGVDPDRIKANALKKGVTAPDFTLTNALGNPVTLSTKLKQGPVILTWYRGGWCPYCSVTLAYLQRYLGRFREAGAELIAITPEKPDDTLTLKERHDLEFEVLTDESNSVAKLYGGVHTLNAEVKRFYKERGVMARYQVDIEEFPVPATYIIVPDGMVLYAFVGSDYGQRAEPLFIVGVIKQYQKQYGGKLGGTLR